MNEEVPRKVEQHWHKMRDCPMIASKVREGKQVAPSFPTDDASTKIVLLFLQDEESVSKLLLVFQRCFD